MKSKIKLFKVSSADWEIEIDEASERCAAISAVISAFNKYGDESLMSTTIMVSDLKNSLESASFFGTHEIFYELGMNNIADYFMNISNMPKNEIKSFT
jgi:hypothetical protein